MSGFGPVQSVWVVMGNDYPDSVWPTKEAANAAVERAKENDRRARPQHLRSPIHFTVYHFEVGKDPWP